MSKITIKNHYHKRLSFPMEHAAFSMDAGEIKTVDSVIGLKLLENGWISEVGNDKVAENVKIAECSSCQPKRKDIQGEYPMSKIKITEKVIKGRKSNKIR